MNYEHIRSLMTERVHTCEVDGQVIQTNGHFAYIMPVPILDNELAKIGEMWRKFRDEKLNDMTRAAPGSLTLQGNRYIRRVGISLVQESYFRCFESKDAEWLQLDTPDEGLCVVENGVMVGLVMPMRDHGMALENVMSATDWQVFQETACEANDYYLADIAFIAKEAHRLQKEIDRANDRISEVQEEREEYEADLKKFQKRLDAMKKAAGEKVTA